MSKQKISLTAIFVQDPTDKGYTGYFAEMPEVIAEGETEEEVQSNLFEALNIMLKFKKEEPDSYNAIAGVGVIERTFELEVA